MDDIKENEGYVEYSSGGDLWLEVNREFGGLPKPGILFEMGAGDADVSMCLTRRQALHLTNLLAKALSDD